MKQRRTVRHTKEGEIIETTYTEIELHNALDAVWKILQLHTRYQSTLAKQSQPANIVVYQLPNGEQIHF